MSDSKFAEAIEFLQMLKEDQDVNKRFKEKTDLVIQILEKSEQLCLEKALSELEDLHSYDISSYLRTQVWDVISLLESMKN